MNANNNHAARQGDSNPENAFTFVDLLVLIGVIVFCAILILPAMARTKTDSSLSQCQNNLKQLAASWAMYPTDNKGWLVSAYPVYGGFTATWCAGNASSSGLPGPYTYGGADPRGITNGLLWPYVKSLHPYKCPADNRIAPPGAPFAGSPILRSVVMNSYLAGTSLGVSPSFSIRFPTGARNPNTPVFLKENEISRPGSIWVILDEDPQSINDGMFLVDMGTSRLVDLPSRLHISGYGINFADGHVENIKLNDSASLTWVPGQTGGINDWRTLTNITTAPLN